MSRKNTKQQQKNTADNAVIEGEVVNSSEESTKEQAADTSADGQESPSAEEQTTADAKADTAEETSKADAEDKADDAEVEAPAAARAAPAQEAKQGATWPGKVALILSVAALGASGYLYWLTLQQTQANDMLRGSLAQEVKNDLNASNSESQRAIADLSRRLDDARAQANADKVSVEELHLRLTRGMEQFNAKQQDTSTEWLLAEVEYLLRLANQRVLMEKTSDGALTLLKSADKLLKETDDISIYDVRKAVAADIAALEAVPVVDTEGVFLKLGAMNEQVDQLRLIPLAEKRELPELLKEITPESVSETWATGLKENWNKALDKLNSLIVIQKRDEKIEPLLSPKETFYLKQNLHLMLEQAQMALLQREQGAFDNSLNSAQQWAAEYFDKNDSATQAIVRGVEELKSVKVAPEVPEITGSLRELKAYLKRMTKLKEEGAK